jgi:hypothetical protein
MNVTTMEDQATILLRLASYLSRPQSFIEVADASSQIRHALLLAKKGSVIFTDSGEPKAVILSAITLEDMRIALKHLLVEEMGVSFALSRQSLRVRRKDASVSSEEELEKLVGEALKTARRRKKSIKKKPDSRRKR